MWSKLVEAFPTSKQTTGTVAKALFHEIIPQWGIPTRISVHNVTHFANDLLKQLSTYLEFDLGKHCAWHPASGGAVRNREWHPKYKLAICCAETGLSWIKALPTVPMYMRMRKRMRTNLSPYEVSLQLYPM